MTASVLPISTRVYGNFTLVILCFKCLAVTNYDVEIETAFLRHWLIRLAVCNVTRSSYSEFLSIKMKSWSKSDFFATFTTYPRKFICSQLQNLIYNIKLRFNGALILICENILITFTSCLHNCISRWYLKLPFKSFWFRFYWCSLKDNASVNWTVRRTSVVFTERFLNIESVATI